MKKTDYTKLRTKILGIIEGLTMFDSKYFNVRRALVYAEHVHCNQRRDGTPEFSHQLEMLSLALSLHNSLLKPYEVYMAIIIHDTIEDYPHTQPELAQMFPDVVNYSRILSKFNDSDLSTYYNYFAQIAACEVCSVVKLIDRIHNLSTAPGVFSTAKIGEYCDEVDMYFLNMMHIAKSNFNQREVYEVLKFILQNEVRTIRAFLRLAEAKEEEERKTVSASELVQRLKRNERK
ncbi:hypothetical protein pEaSNUABM50_00065 [Erwinia phage pEa_SNUABM_50]|uniref:Phosphohydrolase n=1 Tax=Erwinia phage pEa_SNUABM_50 TaxID=2768775 RepID=A0A7L8ZPZ7_9CAUD|nr:hypothetical protein pEaSNUABM50_00065 [Erwinia phage pEa_SNUABM_50]